MMAIDFNQLAATGVVVAVSSSFSTLTTVLIMRYVPRVLDGVEKVLKVKSDKKSGSAGP